MFGSIKRVDTGRVLIAVIVLVFVGAMGAWADDDGNKFEIHGFLTQAYAASSPIDCPPELNLNCNPSPDEASLGIPEGGTWNYRFMALQFRYDISDKDIMVVQLSSRLLGDSPVTELEDDVELDWAFYERRLAENTSLKVGRVQIPLGIYNEIRDVGVILPFYRPPFSWYREGAFTSETVDGLLLAHTFLPETNWPIDVSVYTGEWDIFEQLNDFSQSALARAEDAWGGWVWVNTPVDGLRFGFGGNDKKLSGGVFTRPDGSRPGRLGEAAASIDASFDRFTFRSEFRQFAPKVVTPFFTINLTLSSYYYQLGYRFTDQLSVWLQADYATSRETSDNFVEDSSYDLREDLGIALKYDITPALVVKGEYHWVEEGKQVLGNPIFVPGGPIPLFDPTVFTLDDGSYYILSLSASF